MSTTMTNECDRKVYNMKIVFSRRRGVLPGEGQGAGGALTMSSVDLEKPSYWQYKFGGFVEGVRIHAPAGKNRHVRVLTWNPVRPDGKHA